MSWRTRRIFFSLGLSFFIRRSSLGWRRALSRHSRARSASRRALALQYPCQRCSQGARRTSQFSRQSPQANESARETRSRHLRSNHPRRHFASQLTEARKPLLPAAPTRGLRQSTAKRKDRRFASDEGRQGVGAALRRKNCEIVRDTNRAIEGESPSQLAPPFRSRAASWRQTNRPDLCVALTRPQTRLSGWSTIFVR